MRALISALAVAGLFSVALPGFADDNTVRTGKPADYGRAADGDAVRSVAGLWAAIGSSTDAQSIAASPAASTAGMVLVKGAEFWMGLDDPAFPDAGPAHRVRVSPFWMDATEVTNAALSVESTLKRLEARGQIAAADIPILVFDYNAQTVDKHVASTLAIGAATMLVSLLTGVQFFRLRKP